MFLQYNYTGDDKIESLFRNEFDKSIANKNIFQDNEINNDKNILSLEQILKFLYDTDHYEYYSKIIIELYGKISVDIMEKIIKKMLLEGEYFDNLENIAVKYLDGDLVSVLLFDNKYPNLSNKVFNSGIRLNEKLKQIIKQLASGIVVDGIDSLEFDEIEKNDINCYSNFIGKDIVKTRSIDRISLANDNTQVMLFNYESEIIRIDFDSNIFCYDAYFSHDDTLRKIYRGEVMKNNNSMDIIYRANMKGDILFVIENASLIIWTPSIITTKQQEKVLEMLIRLKNKDAYVAMGVSVPTINYSFMMINGGRVMEVDMAIREFLEIEVSDRCADFKLFSSKVKKVYRD